MTRKTIESLGIMVKEKRGENSLREIAREIGIGPATLMRVENGHTPDIGTFAKLCQWLNVDPGEFLGFKASVSESTTNHLILSGHFRATQSPKPATIKSLANMIALAMKIQTKEHS